MRERKNLRKVKIVNVLKTQEIGRDRGRETHQKVRDKEGTGFVFLPRVLGCWDLGEINGGEFNHKTSETVKRSSDKRERERRENVNVTIAFAFTKSSES